MLHPQHELADLFREKFPAERTFSWWDYRGGAFHRKQGLRIDFLLATPTAMRRVHAVPTQPGRIAVSSVMVDGEVARRRKVGDGTVMEIATKRGPWYQICWAYCSSTVSGRIDSAAAGKSRARNTNRIRV